MPVQTRSRSDKNVVDAKLVRDLAKRQRFYTVCTGIWLRFRLIVAGVAVPCSRRAPARGALRAALAWRRPRCQPARYWETRHHKRAHVLALSFETSRAARPDSPTGRGADSCEIQPWERPYPSADRIKTPALGEVFSSLVPLRFYPSESASAEGWGHSHGVTCRKSQSSPSSPQFLIDERPKKQ